MDQQSGIPPPGLRQLNLKKSFKLGIRSLLTACSKEEFLKAFPTFTKAKQEVLYQLFIQVIASLHESIEEEFESICLETQVSTILDTVEQLVEEQNLDILSQYKTNLLDVKQEVSKAKKDEIIYLKNMLEMASDKNNQMRAQVESLKKNKQEASATPDIVGELRSWNLKYGQIS